MPLLLNDEQMQRYLSYEDIHFDDLKSLEERVQWAMYHAGKAFFLNDKMKFPIYFPDLIYSSYLQKQFLWTAFMVIGQPTLEGPSNLKFGYKAIKYAYGHDYKHFDAISKEELKHPISRLFSKSKFKSDSLYETMFKQHVTKDMCDCRMVENLLFKIHQIKKAEKQEKSLKNYHATREGLFGLLKTTRAGNQETNNYPNQAQIKRSYLL